MRKPYLKNIKSIVIKIGTSVLTKDDQFNRHVINALASDMSHILKRGVHVYVVSSGAIGAGMHVLKLKARPRSIPALQAAAACGQRVLMESYEKAFSKHGFSTAQVLLTWDDLAQRKKFMNARDTLNQIRKWKHIPIINENDTVATEEIRFGDNDRLASLLAVLMEVDVMVVLSDTNGLKSGKGTRRKPVRLQNVVRMDDSIFSHVSDQKNSFTVGGMRSKLNAIHLCVSSGIPVFLADGRQKNVLSRLFAEEDLGTFFVPNLDKTKTRKDWVLHFIDYLERVKNS